MPRVKRNPPSKQERAPNPPRHHPTSRHAKRRGIFCGIQSFCITPIRALL
jgi:hypothetical protein